jgi:uncharacterized protein YcbK (DUF882 family)
MHPDILRMSDDYRYLIGKPAIIHSAVRCEKHNKEVGGVSDSYHLVKKILLADGTEKYYGRAVDFEVDSHEDLKLKVTAAIIAGFNGIGIKIDKNGKGFIHCDLGKKRMFIY